MTVCEKIKTIYYKIQQNKAQYDFDRQTAKISALSSENVRNYKTLIDEDVLLEKGLLEKAVTIKIFYYSSLGSDLKKQANIAGKQHHQLDTAHGLNITQFNKKRENADMLYKNFDFNKFNITNEEFNDLFCDTKYKHFPKLLK